MSDYSDKNTGISQVTKTIATTSTQLIGPNPKRIGLIINSPVANRLTLSFTNPAVADEGIILYAGDQPLHLKRRDFGMAIQQEIFAIMNTAAEGITTVEIVAGH